MFKSLVQPVKLPVRRRLFIEISKLYSKKPEDNFKWKIQQREKELEKQKPEWIKRDESLRKRYGEWNPTRKLSRQQIQDVRNLKDQMPNLKTIDLAKYFNISPEAIRRILKSDWAPNEQEEEILKEKAEKRKEKSRTLKKEVMEDIEKARKRLHYGKSISLNNVYADNNRNITTADNKNLRKSFSSNGKVKFDSSNNHGYYNKNGLRRSKRKPYVESVGDIID